MRGNESFPNPKRCCMRFYPRVVPKHTHCQQHTCNFASAGLRWPSLGGLSLLIRFSYVLHAISTSCIMSSNWLPLQPLFLMKSFTAGTCCRTCKCFRTCDAAENKACGKNMLRKSSRIEFETSTCQDSPSRVHIVEGTPVSQLTFFRSCNLFARTAMTRESGLVREVSSRAQAME